MIGYTGHKDGEISRMNRMLSVLAALFLAPLLADAHHSFDYHFDRSQSITVEGVVKEFRLINPHSHLLLYVTDDAGVTEEWNCELPGVLHQHPGLPHSDQLHTVERITLNETGDLIDVSMVAEDPLHFIEPLKENLRLYQPPTIAPRPHNCTH